MSNEHKQAAQEQQPVTAPAQQAEQQQPAQQAGPGVKQGKAPQPTQTRCRPPPTAQTDTARKTGAVPIGTSGTLFVVHN